ncbi:hypothetical protein C8R44DRAFT_611522, partial [Mycena epipterygia]
YQPRGLYPIFIGNEFAHGHYRVIHKLGFSGSSSIWLACDRKQQSGGLVTLKAMRAVASTKLLPNDLVEI